jgi:hypothetical protein
MKKKKLIGVLLALCLLSGLIPAYAVELPVEEQTTAVCQDGTCWKGPEVTIEVATGSQGSSLQSVVSDPEGAREAIREGILNVEETVDIASYGLSPQEAFAAWEDVFYSTPEAFAVLHSRLLVNSAQTKALKIGFEYNMTKDEYTAAKVYYEETLDSIVSQVDESWSTLEKILFVHDYLAANYEYDTDYKIYDAYQFFLYNRGVCQAYELAFMAVMQELDIPVSYVQSTELNHIWNLVQLDNKWYHLDVTWDSPVPDTLGYAGHEDFLKSDSAFRASHAADDWVYGLDVKCDDTQYDDYFWNAAVTPLRYVNGTWYFIESDFTTETQDDGETVTYYSASRLMAWDGGDGTNNTVVLRDAFVSPATGLEYFDGKFYFYGYDYYGGSGIYTYDLETKSLGSLIQYVSNPCGLIMGDSTDGWGKVLIYQVDQEYYAYYLEVNSGGENSGYQYFCPDANTLWLGLDGTTSVIAAAMDSDGKLISTETYSESGTYDLTLPEGTAEVQIFSLKDLESFVPACPKVQVTVDS